MVSGATVLLVGRAWQPGCVKQVAETSKFLAGGNTESLGTSESSQRPTATTTSQRVLLLLKQGLLLGTQC